MSHRLWLDGLENYLTWHRVVFFMKVSIVLALFSIALGVYLRAMRAAVIVKPEPEIQNSYFARVGSKFMSRLIVDSIDAWLQGRFPSAGFIAPSHSMPFSLSDAHALFQLGGGIA